MTTTRNTMASRGSMLPCLQTRNMLLDTRYTFRNVDVIPCRKRDAQMSNRMSLYLLHDVAAEKIAGATRL